MTMVSYKLYLEDSGDGYGMKFALETGYNKQLVKSIKRMDWKLSHRGWDQYSKVWRFDINDYVVEELRILGVDVPDLEKCKAAEKALTSAESDFSDDTFPIEGELEVFE